MHVGYYVRYCAPATSSAPGPPSGNRGKGDSTKFRSGLVASNKLVEHGTVPLRQAPLDIYERVVGQCMVESVVPSRLESKLDDQSQGMGTRPGRGNGSNSGPDKCLRHLAISLSPSQLNGGFHAHVPSCWSIMRLGAHLMRAMH